MDVLANIFVIIFGTSLLVGFSGALAPGPVTAVNIRDSIIDGPKVGVLLTTGHAICEFAIVCVLLIGIAPFMSSLLVRITIGALGGTFLLYLSYKGLRNQPHLPDRLNTIKLSGNRSGSYIYLGVMVTLGNPYVLIWWSTVGLNYIMWSYVYGMWGILCFYLGHILSDYIWNCTDFCMIKGENSQYPLVQYYQRHH